MRRQVDSVNTQCGIALDALSIVYMSVLIVNMKYKQKRELLNRQYFRINFLICIFLALDIAYLGLYGTAGPTARIFLKIIKSLYFIVNTAIVWAWARYIDLILFASRAGAGKHTILYTAVFFGNTALVLINFFTGILFGISSGGTFLVRPAAMWCFTLLNYLSILLVYAVLIKNKKRLERRNYYTLLIFPLPPLCAEIIQIFCRPCSLICTYAVSALIIFQISQTQMIHTDELTGLANRRLLNETLRKWFANPCGFTICGLMLDLDNLKQINDQYGHLMGDKALLLSAEILRQIKRRDIIAARYGGDEFILIWRAKERSDISAVTQSLLAAKERICAGKPEKEKIEFSTGCFDCRDDEKITIADFLTNIDEAMYQSKKEKQRIRN